MSNNWDKIGESEKESEGLLQEEFRRAKEMYDKEHHQLKRQEAEKHAIEERNRRNEIYTKLDNAKFGLMLSGVLTLILFLLLITKTGKAFGIVITLIVVFGFLLYGIGKRPLYDNNPFFPTILLGGLPVLFLISLPIFVDGWPIIWVVLILVTAISSFITLRKYKYSE